MRNCLTDEGMPLGCAKKKRKLHAVREMRVPGLFVGRKEEGCPQFGPDILILKEAKAEYTKSAVPALLPLVEARFVLASDYERLTDKREIIPRLGTLRNSLIHVRRRVISRSTR